MHTTTSVDSLPPSDISTDPQAIELQQQWLTMYIVLRRDLSKQMNWPTGSVIAQAAHASTAVLHKHADDANVIKYMDDLDHMHKVVLESKNETSLRTIAAKLKEENLKFYEWIEQPENILTCIATVPYQKHVFKDIFKRCQLYK